jgi:arsenite methyltransferase
MARLPFTGYGFTLRPIAEVIAALEKAGLEVIEQQRPDEMAIPHNLLVARRPD